VKFNTLIFLIIAFNVVVALMRQRARKAGAPSPGSIPSPPSTEKSGALPDSMLSPVSGLGEALADTRPAVPVAPIHLEKPSIVYKRDVSGILSNLRGQLRDHRRIQEAFILKEILDPPVASRRGIISRR
jgi:hypothetical protein